MRDLGKRFRQRSSLAKASSSVLGQMFFHFAGRWQSATEVFKDLGYGDQRIWHDTSAPFKSEYCWDDLHPGPPWTSGGPFSKVTVDFPTRNTAQGFSWHEKPNSVFHHPMLGFVPTAWNGGYTLYGIDHLDSAQPLYGNISAVFDSNQLAPDPSQWGPEAWAKSAPRIEMASGFVALAESRDLPRLLQDASRSFKDKYEVMGGNRRTFHMSPKKVANAFLNQQFGWIPFLSDIGKFHKAFSNTHKYMSRMTHGNDKWKVYRRELVNETVSTQIYEGSDWKVIPFGQFHESHLTDGKPPVFEVWEDQSTLVTSSGRFKWYRPEFDWALHPELAKSSPWNDVMKQMRMYGVRVSPSNVWRATPWTWLVDWGLNVGQNIDRLQEFVQDGVVSQYLYVMAHSIRTLRFKQTIPFTSGPITLEYRRILDVKQRTPAGSPYGFGTSWDSLTPRRIAILGALGISRFG